MTTVKRTILKPSKLTGYFRVFLDNILICFIRYKRTPGSKDPLFYFAPIMPQIPHITLQVVPKAPMRYIAHTFWSLGSQPTKILHLGVPEKTPCVVNCQGVQDVNCIHHYLVPDAGGVGARSQPIKYSASGSPNKSADSTYNPVSGPQGPQEAHGIPLLVPGAEGVGQIIMTHGYKHRVCVGL